MYNGQHRAFKEQNNNNGYNDVNNSSNNDTKKYQIPKKKNIVNLK